MKKLDEIPKKNIYTVPEGYFDELPGIIQSRVSAKSKAGTRPYFSFALRYALPAVVLILGAIFWINNRPDVLPQSAEEILATIDTESLVTYLEESEITTDDLLETVDFTQSDVTEIENSIYDFNLQDEDLDDLLNAYDDELSNF